MKFTDLNLSRITQLQMLVESVSDLAFIEAFSRHCKVDEDAIKLLDEDQRKELAAGVFETVDTVKEEWISESDKLPDDLPDNFDEAKTNFEGWVLAHRLIFVLVMEEALHRTLTKHGFAGMDYFEYIALFPEDMKDAVNEEIRETFDEVDAEFKQEAVDTFYKRLIEATEKTFQLDLMTEGE